MDPFNQVDANAVIVALVDAVRGFDRSVISAENVDGIFTSFRVPGFSFSNWLAEMADEDIYVQPSLRQAA